jgi:hypothetical protein
VFAAEHLLDLAGLDFLVQQLQGLRELGIHRFTRFRPFDKHGEIVALLLEREHEIAILLQATAALQNFLRFGLILPEIGSRGARFEAGQLFVRFRTLKDSSADRRRVC